MSKNNSQKNIPDGWKTGNMKNHNIAVIDGDRGKNYPHEDDFFSDGYCLFLNAGNVTKNGFDFSDKKFISSERDNLLGKGKLKRGDLIITTRGTIGNISFYSDKINFDNIRINSGMAIIRNNNKKIKTEFLLNYFISSNFRKEIKRVSFGSAQPQLTIQIINKFTIKIPEDKSEQNRIVSVLETWDKAIEKLAKKIEIKKQIKKGLMQDLLTGKKRLSGFDNKWIFKMLGDVCGPIKTGKLDANAMIENGKYRFYTCAKDYYFIDDYAFDTEALLISGNGANVGYIHYYKGKFNAYQRTYVLDKFKTNIFFTKYLLDNFLHRRISDEKCDGNTPYIKMDTLTEMSITIPESLQEQTAIANILTTADQEIAKLEKKLSIVKDQKKYLLNNLITGAIRTNA